MATVAAEARTLAPPRRPSFIRILAARNRIGLIAGAVLLLFVLAAITAPLLAPGIPSPCLRSTG